MGDSKKILVIGRHADMMSKITHLLNQHGYDSIGELTNEGAVNAFKSNVIDAVIIGGGVDTESRTYFHEEFLRMNPNVKIIDAHPQTVLQDLSLAFSS